MCRFFSFVSDKKGSIYYFDWKLRQKWIKEKLDGSPDSHTTIADHFGFKGEKEDSLDKWEYDLFSQVITHDRGPNSKDERWALRKAKSLDFEKIVPGIRIKPVVNPLLIDRGIPTERELRLLKKWASVGASVWASVRESVWASVRESVGASVWAYVSSYFPKVKFKYDFSPCIELWEAGLVPSFDGNVWRLHSGKDAKVVWEGKI